MAALTAPKKMKKKDGGPFPENLAFPIAANTKIYNGGLVMLDGGYLKPGAVAVSKIAVGVARVNRPPKGSVTNVQGCADNTGGAAGAFKVEIEEGIFPFENHGADLVVAADVGSDCFIVDDQTVAKTNGGATRSRAGKIVDLDSAGKVWVKLGLGI